MFSVYEYFNRINEINPKIRMDAGDPDIPVRREIIEAAVRSLRNGETRYTATAGLPELRERIAELEDVSPEEVIIAPGAKILIASEIAMAKRVTIIAPYWNAYLLISHQFGKKLEVIETRLENRWTPQIEDFDGDLLVLNYPNNPTGRVLSSSKVREIAEIVEDKGAKLLSDEIYGDLSFVNFTSPRKFYEKTVTVKGFSKLYSMTGFRLGYAIAEKEEIERIKRFIEASVTCVPSFVQRAGLKALELREEIVNYVRKEYQGRVKTATEILRRFEFIKPESAFYIFLKIAQDGIVFAEKLLKKNVAVFPGIAFGDYSNFIRISLAGKRWKEGLEIIGREMDASEHCGLQ